MPAIGVQHCLRDFQNDVSRIHSFLEDTKNYYIRLGPRNYRHIGVRRVEMLAGLALLKLHLAWEDFLERSFVRYMCGATAVSGYSPTLLSTPERSVSSAMSNLLGHGKYLNWSVHGTLVRAGAYFDKSEPFNTPLRASQGTLDEISIIRNRFAHRSEHSVNEFRNVIISAIGYVPRGMSPGRFLLTSHPLYSAVGMTFFDYYVNVLLGASSAIIP